MSFTMFGLGLALLLLSSLLADKPALASVLKGMRESMPWAFFIGALLLGLYFIVRKAAVPPVKPPADPPFFGESTTAFHEPPGDAKPPA